MNQEAAVRDAPTGFGPQQPVVENGRIEQVPRCSATRRMAGFRRSDGRSQRGVMMAFPKVSDKKICR
jgi:hypothetical protein